MENRILLKHFLIKLRMEHEIEIRDEDNYKLFSCTSSSTVLNYYGNREVIEWFAYSELKICILIGGE